MVYRGRVRGGVIQLDSGPTLPEGAAVIVKTVPESAAPTEVDDDPLWKMGTNPISLDIADLAENHDKYLADHPL